jgi:Tfp pilus assembly protein PilX
VSIGPLVWSIVAVLVALVVLALLVVGALRAVRRTRAVLAAFTGPFADRTGMLRARVAAVRVRTSRLGSTSGSSDSATVGPVDSDITMPISVSGSGGALQ